MMNYIFELIASWTIMNFNNKKEENENLCIVISTISDHYLNSFTK